MMKRAKGATLAEIMKATGWQAHTVRGFVSILGSKGGEKIESSKNAAGERPTRSGSKTDNHPVDAALGSLPGGVPFALLDVAGHDASIDSKDRSMRATVWSA